MPSTHTCLHFHLIFSTKERLPLITKDWRERFHSYLGGIVKGLEGVPLAVGGVEDHVHLLVGLKSKHRLDYFSRDLKADSTMWFHREPKKKFEWQKGYAAFTVSPSNIEGVKNYVLNQEHHHQKNYSNKSSCNCRRQAESSTTRNIYGENWMRIFNARLYS